jgi:hypothetical protein
LIRGRSRQVAVGSRKIIGAREARPLQNSVVFHRGKAAAAQMCTARALKALTFPALAGDADLGRTVVSRSLHAESAGPACKWHGCNLQAPRLRLQRRRKGPTGASEALLVNCRARPPRGSSGARTLRLRSAAAAAAKCGCHVGCVYLITSWMNYMYTFLEALSKKKICIYCRAGVWCFISAPGNGLTAARCPVRQTSVGATMIGYGYGYG